MNLGYTRRMVSAALSGELDETETYQDTFFGLNVPVKIEGVPDRILRPRDTWADPDAYDVQANKLANMFNENFEKFADAVSEDVVKAGPPVK